MIEYYARRAKEYELVYAKPERQPDLAWLREKCRSLFAGRSLLEISCGTGYWTEAFATTARSVLATDLNPAVLDIARAKPWDGAPVEFHCADSFALPDFARGFEGGFAGFWWSHIPKDCLQGFLADFHSCLEPGALVAFIDNRFVDGSSTPLSRRANSGDTYQLRQLSDGSTHEVMKNFPTDREIHASIIPFSRAIEITHLDHFWMVTYRLP